MRNDHEHRKSKIIQGPITFTIEETPSRTKMIGTTKTGFRSFAYISDGRLEDAKRAIINDYEASKDIC